MKTEVELWSTDPSAVEATRQTIQQLPPGNGLLVGEDGHWFLIGDDFLRWACKRQGYVKRIVGATP